MSGRSTMRTSGGLGLEGKEQLGAEVLALDPEKFAPSNGFEVGAVVAGTGVEQDERGQVVDVPA
jgi:hypothetical protein